MKIPRSKLWSKIYYLKTSRNSWKKKFEKERQESQLRIEQLEHEKASLETEVKQLSILESKHNGWAVFENKYLMECNHESKHARGMCKTCYNYWWIHYKLDNLAGIE